MLSLSLFIGIIIVFTDLYFQRTITRLINHETTEELENYSYLGLSLLDTHYPGEWRLEGDKLYKGDTLINDNFEVVDEFSAQTGILATIFAGDTRVSTTVKEENGNRKVGTKASDGVVKTVITENKAFQGPAEVAGSKADTYYVPLYDESDKVVGMWFVGVYSEEIEAKINSAMLSILGMLGFILLVGGIVSYLIGRGISKGFERIKADLIRLENGDFNFTFNHKLAEKKDEIGEITRSFIHMQTQISNIIKSIKEETSHIETSSNLLLEGADNVYNDVEDISATTEELSAGMEETAASTQEMNATAVEIEHEIGSVAKKASHGQEIASEIKKRAENLKGVALESQKSAIEIYDMTNKKLRQSIEKTSAIEEIQNLSKTILSITAQTNLLALNASIEAARAGDAGKGFAVVANEIAVLAKNSKNAVSKIEEISHMISVAVDDMVKDSNSLLEFMDHQVIRDYEVQVKTGEQYDDDAITVEAMVSEIKHSAMQLNESIHYIRQAIDEVTSATNEGSKGSADIAEKSNSIFHKTTLVLEQANTNKEIAAHLNEMVQFFQI
ncbi:MAG: methyl-accepting chemotaxis sensory transducer [Herbinix sp.]|nr:methyl-accepting chemotaxis sensory transducer [Herbinix sp.]